MELYQLQSFITVAQTGSLSKAAVARNISLSGISKHIKMLEEEIRQYCRVSVQEPIGGVLACA